MTRWHPTSALAGLPGMPGKAIRAITFHGPGRGWESRRRGRGLEWLESSLPAQTQAALAERRRTRPVRARSRGLPAFGEADADAPVVAYGWVPARVECEAE